MKLGVLAALTAIACGTFAQQTMEGAARELRDTVKNAVSLILSTESFTYGSPVGLPVSFFSYDRCQNMPSTGEPIVAIEDNSYVLKHYNASGKISMMVQRSFSPQDIPEKTSKAVFFGKLEKIDNSEALVSCIKSTPGYNEFLTSEGKGSPCQYYKLNYDNIYYMGPASNPDAYVGWIETNFYKSI